MTSRFVLLDLDGTLVDPAPGIVGAFQHALRRLGAPVPEAETLHWIIGPPLRVSFAQQLGGDTHVEEALAAYRDVYGAGGLFDAEVYPDIPDALSEMRDAGFRLILCTAKPIPFARRITERFGLSAYFDAQYGSELDGRFDDKGTLIAHLLEREGLHGAQGVMVGDRANDTTAAARNTLPSVGVRWGFGSDAELTEGGATRLCDTPHDLHEAVTACLSAG